MGIFNCTISCEDRCRTTKISRVFQIFALNQGKGGGDTSDPDATATVTGFPKSKTGTGNMDTTDRSSQTDITAVSTRFTLQTFQINIGKDQSKSLFIATQQSFTTFQTKIKVTFG